jgi:broad specificity polyphosphatase/5'/3'-nucleotidase SurE
MHNKTAVTAPAAKAVVTVCQDLAGAAPAVKKSWFTMALSKNKPLLLATCKSSSTCVEAFVSSSIEAAGTAASTGVVSLGLFPGCGK